MKKVTIIGLSGDSLFYEVAHLPKLGETVCASSLHREVGGKGFNQAITLARQGIKVNYLTALGNDEIKTSCEKVLKEEGINALIKEKNIESACASIIKTKDGKNEIAVFMGANNLLDLNDLKDFTSYIRESDAILITYEIPYEIVKKAVEIAKENNLFILINPAPYTYDDLELLKDADIVCPNETELMAMMKTDTIDDMKVLDFIKAVGIKKLVLTMGADGVCIYDKNVTKIPAPKVKAVDTTGAGDVFNASMLTYLLLGKNIYEACEFGVGQASASVCTKFVLDSIPRGDKNEK